MRPHTFEIQVNGEKKFSTKGKLVANIELVSSSGAVTSFDGEVLNITFNEVSEEDDLTQHRVPTRPIEGEGSEDLTLPASPPEPEDVENPSEVQSETSNVKVPVGEVPVDEVAEDGENVLDLTDESGESNGSNDGPDEPNGLDSEPTGDSTEGNSEGNDA